MAKCKQCERVIPDGEDYCNACKETNDHTKKTWIKILGTAAVADVAIIFGLNNSSSSS